MQCAPGLGQYPHCCSILATTHDRREPAYPSMVCLRQWILCLVRSGIMNVLVATEQKSHSDIIPHFQLKCPCQSRHQESQPRVKRGRISAIRKPQNLPLPKWVACGIVKCDEVPPGSGMPGPPMFISQCKPKPSFNGSAGA